MSYLTVTSLTMFREIATLVKEGNCQQATMRFAAYATGVLGQNENPALRDLVGRLLCDVTHDPSQKLRCAQEIQTAAQLFCYKELCALYAKDIQCYWYPFFFQFQRHTFLLFKTILAKEEAQRFSIEQLFPAYEEYLTKKSLKGLESCLKFLLSKAKEPQHKIELRHLIGTLCTPELLMESVYTFLPQDHPAPDPELGMIELLDHFRIMRSYFLACNHYSSRSASTQKMEKTRLEMQKMVAIPKEQGSRAFLNLIMRFFHQSKNAVRACGTEIVGQLEDFLNRQDTPDLRQVQEWVEFLDKALKKAEMLSTFAYETAEYIPFCSFKQLEKEWSAFREVTKKATFSAFFHQKLAQYLAAAQNPSSKEGHHRAEYRLTMQEDFEEQYRSQFEDCQKKRVWLKGLFHLPLIAAERLTKTRSFKLVYVPTEKKGEKKGDEKTSSDLVIEDVTPSRKASSSAAVASKTDHASALFALLQEQWDTHKEKCADLAKPYWQQSVWQMQTLVTLLERLTHEKTAAFPAVCLFLKESSRALEQCLKTMRLIHNLPPLLDKHNLLHLKDDLPLSDASLLLLWKMNYAEMATRDVSLFEPEENLSFAQSLVLKAQTQPFAQYTKDFSSLVEALFLGFLEMSGCQRKEKREQACTLLQGLLAQDPPSPLKQQATCHLPLLQKIEILRKTLADLPSDCAPEYVANIDANLLACLEAEVRFSPKPAGIRTHLTVIFESLPLLAENLLAIALIHNGSEQGPGVFQHNLLGMLKETGIRVRDKDLLDFLGRTPEYLQLRYLASAHIRDATVLRVAKGIRIAQDKPIEFSAPTDGLSFPKESASHEFHTLIALAEKEFSLLQKFAEKLIKSIE